MSGRWLSRSSSIKGISYSELPGPLLLLAGLKDFRVLKTTQSGYEGYLRDQYTLLPETRERMMASSITATWKCASDLLPSTLLKNFRFPFASIARACAGRKTGEWSKTLGVQATEKTSISRGAARRGCSLQFYDNVVQVFWAC